METWTRWKNYTLFFYGSFNGYEDTTNEVSILKVIHESTDGLVPGSDEVIVLGPTDGKSA